MASLDQSRDWSECLAPHRVLTCHSLIASYQLPIHGALLVFNYDGELCVVVSGCYVTLNLAQFSIGVKSSLFIGS